MAGSLAHHKQADTCTNRPEYRNPRQERAVKVYTINQESRYLLVLNVPSLGVVKDLMELFSLYGEIEEYRILDEYPCEPYTDVYLIKYREIESAKLAKNKLDNHYFFSKDLHVCYAPEFESVSDTREKLNKRRTKIRKFKKNNAPSSTRKSTLPSSSSRPHSTIHVDPVPVTTTTTVHRPSLLQVPSHQEIPLPPPLPSHLAPSPSHLAPSPSHHLIPLLPPLPPPPPPRPLLPRPSIIVPHIGHGPSPLFSPPLHVSSLPHPHPYRRPNRCPFHGPVPLIHSPPRGPIRLPIRSPPHGSRYVPPVIGASPGTPPLISPSPPPPHSTPPPLIHTTSSSNHIHQERGVLISPTKKATPLLHNPPNPSPLITCTSNASLLTPPPLISIANTVQPPPLVSDRVHVPASSSKSLLRPPILNDHQSQSHLSRNSVRPPFTGSAQTGKDQLPLTGNPSVDLTILSVRNKMSQVFNTNAARDYAPPQTKKRR
ncbi:PREDICTED: pollen-specific leucine-rich repeat extensin-like protein 3 isoform X2 [Amphimedon queenslandica]|uniref:RNA-binding protein 48 n=1 Tax=Amphimedon queenslandica TaxID=400682 RepID=A0AAN0JAG9_AMPQE|nr:PREDICTED: pollen-specific leucine-rich repeat extensin-like protein 3 isoform X2 [Amphimedon queenslandica]|eukprot:XP_019853964.1 PREDICTED: pollen-specific leucine-rich repeat extensin-like protein 3 isoform X2 [Amphimedon queenslandica]